jgi:hypothetical protein
MSITQEQIQEKAIQLFGVFSAEMNKQTDSYCVKFEHLTNRHRFAWLAVAEHELKNVKQNSS